MKYRVIQWATGGVGRAAIEGILSHPELELVGCWVHSADEGGHGRRRARRASGRSACARRTTSTALLALDADCVLYSPLMAKRDGGDPDPRVGQERRDAARLVLPVPSAKRRRARGGVPQGRRHAARHRHPSGRHHRALPADDLGALAQRSRTCAPRSSPTSAPTARRRWSREVMLFGKTPEQAAKSPMLAAARRRLPAVDRHGRRRARLRARRRRSARSTRWRSRRRRSTRRSARSRPASSRRSASPGRAPCAASP